MLMAITAKMVENIARGNAYINRFVGLLEPPHANIPPINHHANKLIINVIRETINIAVGLLLISLIPGI